MTSWGKGPLLTEEEPATAIQARAIRRLHGKIKEKDHTIQQLMGINRNLLKSLHDSWQSRLPELFRLYQMGDDLAEGELHAGHSGASGAGQEDSTEA